MVLVSDDNMVFAYNGMVLLPKVFMLNPRGTMLHPHINRLRMEDQRSGRLWEGGIPSDLLEGIVLGILQSPAVTRLNAGIDITERISDVWIPEYNVVRIRFRRGAAYDDIRVDLSMRADSMVRISMSHVEEGDAFYGVKTNVAINRRSLDLGSMWFDGVPAARERAKRRLATRWVDEVEYVDGIHRPEYSVRILDGDWLWTAVVDPQKMPLEWLFG